MVDPGWLAGGLIIGLAFAALMVFKILPAADQVVKKQYGPCEAYLTTRFCCLCIALPFYVLTIWMVLVVTFHSDKGVELIQQMCPDDYLCSNSFAMGRTNHDLEACTSPDCGLDNYLARSGSQPLRFPRLGLGKDMELRNETRTYSCEKVSVSEDFPLAICSEIKDIKSKQVCECVDLNFELGICEKYKGCDDDISKSLHITTCEKRFTTEESICTIWNVKIDSAKQFGFRDCLCNSFGEVNGNQVCDQWTCDELTMDYYYPNVFFAGAVTILFIFPLMAITYYTAKTQLRKICKCGDFQMYVYSQEAGIQSETVAENLATGGFTNTQQGKSKYRTFSRKDVGLLLLSPLAMLFFGWLVVESAGRVGLAFIGLAGGLIAARELYKYTKFIAGRKDRLDERIERNNPSPTYF